MTNLKDKVVFITGAARGIGAACAKQLAARGARCVLAGMEPDKLSALQAELGSDHAWFECDVTQQSTLDSAVRGAVERFGGIDVVLANAGIANNGTIAVNPIDAVARVIDVNLTGVARTVSATLPSVISRRGYYLLVSSAAAFRPMPGMAAYAASKVGVEHFGSAVRLEVAHHGVGVGIAHPGWIDTDMVRDVKKDFSTFNEMLKRMPWPLNKTISVEECAAGFVAGIERRAEKVYVPSSLILIAGIRNLINSSFANSVLAKQAAEQIPQLEAEVKALGRAFGTSSVEQRPRLPHQS